MISTHVYVAELLGPAGVQLAVDEDSPGEISLDAGRARHVEATLTCAIPSVDVLELLDPRVKPRVRISVLAAFDRTTQTRAFDLGVRRRPVPLGNATYSLDLASDEALLEDYAPLTDINLTGLSGSGRALVNAVLAAAIAGAALAAGPDFEISLDASDDLLVWRAGTSALEFLRPIVQAAGRRLVCDETRTWTLRDENYTAPGSLSIRYGLSLIDGEDLIDIDSGLWYDAAAVLYRWTDGAGVQQERVDAFAAQLPYARLERFERDSPYPGPGFAEYAVRRAAGRGREVTMVTVADWRARAEQPVIGVLPLTPTQTGVTQTVTFALATDEMTVTTRTTDTPPYAWLFLEPEESWLDSPEGASWIDEVI